jgi:hypothetical protein
VGTELLDIDSAVGTELLDTGSAVGTVARYWF